MFILGSSHHFVALTLTVFDYDDYDLGQLPLHSWHPVVPKTNTIDLEPLAPYIVVTSNPLGFVARGHFAVQMPGHLEHPDGPQARPMHVAGSSYSGWSSGALGVEGCGRWLLRGCPWARETWQTKQCDKPPGPEPNQRTMSKTGTSVPNAPWWSQYVTFTSPTHQSLSCRL